MGFTYPVDGYLPLQNPPTTDLVKAHKLLGYIKNVLSTAIDPQVGTGDPDVFNLLFVILFGHNNI